MSSIKKITCSKTFSKSVKKEIHAMNSSVTYLSEFRAVWNIQRSCQPTIQPLLLKQHQAVTSVVVIEVILQPIERSRFLSWWNCLESQWMISISRTKSWASKSRTRQQLPYYTNPHMRECGAELGARDDFWEVKLRNCTLIQILQKHIKLSFSSKGLQNLFLFIFFTLSSSEC